MTINTAASLKALINLFRDACTVWGRRERVNYPGRVREEKNTVYRIVIKRHSVF